MVKGSGLEAQLPSHGRLCATTDGKSVTSPDQSRGCEPQPGEGKPRMRPGSAQANESSSPVKVRGGEPKAREREPHTPATTTARVSAQPVAAETGPSRPDTSLFAYQDCLLALRELGYDDIADTVEKRWFDVESA